MDHYYEIPELGSGHVRFQDCSEPKVVAGKLVLELTWEDDTGHVGHCLFPLTIKADPENGPEFDSEPYVDGEELPELEGRIWDMYCDYCCFMAEQERERDF